MSAIACITSTLSTRASWKQDLCVQNGLGEPVWLGDLLQQVPVYFVERVRYVRQHGVQFF